MLRELGVGSLLDDERLTARIPAAAYRSRRGEWLSASSDTPTNRVRVASLLDLATQYRIYRLRQRPQLRACASPHFFLAVLGMVDAVQPLHHHWFQDQLAVLCIGGPATAAKLL